MAECKTIAPTFLVPDVSATADWYRTALGFQVHFVPKAPPYVFASLQREGVEIMLLSQEGYRKPEVARAGGVWDAYIRIRDIREFYEQVRTRITVSTELIRRPYGDWEFEVRDPSGYALVFGEQA
jgi:uncharacterized glyoxalase superfamily protein PhnB